MKHIKWPSIASFHNVRKLIRTYPELCNGALLVKYRGKVKLHGTNSAICLTSNGIYAQNRTQIITPQKDNVGFAAWVESVKDKLVRTYECIGHDTVVYGEWVGPGINKGTAAHKIKNKIFAIFAAYQPEIEKFTTDPFFLRLMLLGMLPIPDVYILPWQTNELTVSWTRPVEELQSTVDALNKAVSEVEACDPWVKDMFDIEGLGEGLVYYPVSAKHEGRKCFSDLAFKAKGRKHKVVATKRPVQVDPEVAKSIEEFVNLVVTEARLEQGVAEACNVEFNTSHIGKFIGFVTKDCNKECQDELEASNLKWKQVSKSIANKARNWYLRKIETT